MNDSECGYGLIRKHFLCSFLNTGTHFHENQLVRGYSTQTRIHYSDQPRFCVLRSLKADLQLTVHSKRTTLRTKDREK